MPCPSGRGRRPHAHHRRWQAARQQPAPEERGGAAPSSAWASTSFRSTSATASITTIYGDHMDGRVEGVSGGLLRLRSSPAMGYAITNFDRGKIRSIISME
jgi:hypothetical protein